jgi:hypothetical protein
MADYCKLCACFVLGVKMGGIDVEQKRCLGTTNYLRINAFSSLFSPDLEIAEEEKERSPERGQMTS